MTKSELWFQRYAAEHSLRGGDEHEPELGEDARPDFRISAGGPGVICEVKEFVTSSFHRGLQDPGVKMLSPRDQHGTVRNKIGKAAKRQLRPYADRGEALVIVLANPRDVQVDIYEPGGVVEAMYGDLGYTFQVNPSTGEGGPGRWVCLDGGVFGGGRHTYVSAVVVLHRGTHAADARQRWMDEQRWRWNDMRTPRSEWRRCGRSSPMIRASPRQVRRRGSTSSRTPFRPSPPPSAKLFLCPKESSTVRETRSGWWTETPERWNW